MGFHFRIWGHPFLTFLMLVFRKILRTYLMDGSYLDTTLILKVQCLWFLFVPCGKRPLIVQEEIERCHQFFQFTIFLPNVVRGYFRNWGQLPEDAKKAGVILETEGSVQKMQKRALFSYSRVKRAPLVWPLPMFIASLQLFW